jgi:hypothetical protein
MSEQIMQQNVAVLSHLKQTSPYIQERVDTLIELVNDLHDDHSADLTEVVQQMHDQKQDMQQALASFR